MLSSWQTEDLFEKFERYIATEKPGFVVKKVCGDGLCIITSFQEGFLYWYKENISINTLKEQLRGEFLFKYEFYSQFSAAEVNILEELDEFLKNPLKYYNSDTVDLL